jgi:hypothetical protein
VFIGISYNQNKTRALTITLQSIFQHPWVVIEQTIIKKPSPPQTKNIQLKAQHVSVLLNHYKVHPSWYRG